LTGARLRAHGGITTILAMGEAGGDLNDIVQSFYFRPDEAGALRAFEDWLRSPGPDVIDLHVFTRMAMVSPAVRGAMQALRSRSPAVEVVLRGFADPDFPRVGDGPPAPHELDLLWIEFFITGDTAPLRRILGVLDEPDLSRARLTQWLRDTGTGFLGKRRFARFVPVFARCAIPVQFESMDVGGPLDVDLTVALSARAGMLKFDELPFPLTEAERLRIAAKSAAIWSLRQNARTHEPVAALCGAEATRPGGAGRLLLDQVR